MRTIHRYLAAGLGLAALVALGAERVQAQAQPPAAPATPPAPAVPAAPAAPAMPAARPAAGPPKVRITSPQNRAVVTGTSVHVTLEAQGIEIAPASEERPGTAHHHLFLDTDLTSPEVKIPQGTTGIIHLGRGQTEFTFDKVAPGPHRLIAELADFNHIPLKPLAVDTVRFTVKAP